MNVFPIQTPPESDGAKCPNCGAQVAADQRYCLACGQPCSPVRLPFLDVLQAESELRRPVAYAPPTAGYLPPLPADDGAIAWLRRYSGLFGLIAVLLICGLIGPARRSLAGTVQSVGPIDRQDRGHPARGRGDIRSNDDISHVHANEPNKSGHQQKRAGYRSAGSQGSKRS